MEKPAGGESIGTQTVINRALETVEEGMVTHSSRLRQKWNSLRV